MGQNIRANLNDLLNGLSTGRLLEVFDKYYHNDVVMSENAENDPKRHGKAANRGYEEFFVNNAQWHDARLDRIAVDEENGTSAYEMYMDLTFMGNRMQRTQVAFQTWKDGQIINETFYYK